MLPRFLLLCGLVPLLEIYLLMKIAAVIGAMNTIALVIISALLGVMLARREGLRSLRQISDSLRRGDIPAEEVLDTVLIFVAAILLLIPGVLTDLVAFMLLIPYTRTLFKRWLRRRFDRAVATRNLRVQYYASDEANTRR